MAVAFGVVDGRPVIAAAYGWERSVLLWDAVTGKPRGDPLPHGGRVHAVSVCSIDDEPVVVTGSHDGRVQTWDARTGKAWRAPLRHGDRVLAVASGALDEGVAIASAASERADDDPIGTVRLWDARTGRRRMTVGHRGVCALALGHVDGMPVVVSGSLDGMLRLWQVPEDRATARLRAWLGRGRRVPSKTGTGRSGRRAHDGAVRAVAMTVVHGRPVVVSGGDDGAVRLWDPRTAQAWGAPLLHDSAVTALAVLDLGSRPALACGSGRTVRLWELDTPAPDRGVSGPTEVA